MNAPLAPQAERVAQAVRALEGLGARVLDYRGGNYALPLVMVAARPPAEAVGGEISFSGALDESMRTGHCTSLFGVELTWEEPREVHA